ncbi:threonine ammonia-lyase [Polymorphobacter fuscus]|uniref:Pyridoxal-phosphate dependent enzyme n=1 Tax=Sandarakinorhabdus fusca TaxID=1439888 RepID=A0A7C9GMM0_9SPHN|nr:pyridoxal-phosphate dependent enzyme [Polymorphobacter fuscus]KAB7648488.1 pyridoxal-phosphate dependent enzyme [Polymorphobacter fuscus]MQT16015.1 pyridoxal-phosphate dependent enzyme [Polymorphobacter fuscus]NJC07708.1 threonine dehydratase [Polymorphobacter fuscus]
MTSPVLYDEVVTAAGRIAGVAVRTPLLRSDALDAATGARIWLKPENLQRTGSFKFRGAFNRLSAIPMADRGAGVVAFSSGNHAQGVALAAKLLGLPAVIVMPSDAPGIKVERTRGHGAEVVFYDRLTEDRDAIAGAIAAQRGAVVVPPFNDRHVIAGQGTAGMEAVADLAALGVAADLALVCCGGGGLASGFAVGSRLPVIAVEPEGYDDVVRSLAGGAIVPVDNPGPTRCDALQTLKMAPLTFDTLRAHGATGMTVGEVEAARAVAFAFRELKLVVEPGGAVALAAALSGRADIAGRTVVVILSGGNVEPAIFAECLAA